VQEKDGWITHRGIVARSPDSPKCSRISHNGTTGSDSQLVDYAA
jgi:hypothetical protein